MCGTCVIYLMANLVFSCVIIMPLLAQLVANYSIVIYTHTQKCVIYMANK